MSNDRDGPFKDFDFLGDSPRLHRFVDLVHLVIVAATAAVMVGLMISPEPEYPRLVPVAATLLVVAVSHWRQRHSPRQAIAVLALGMWVMNAGSVLVFAGIHGAQMVIFPFLLVMIGWVLGLRWLALTTLLTVGLAAGLGVAEHLGLHHPTPRAQPLNVAAIVVGVLAASAMLSAATFHALGGSVARSRLRAGDLASELERQNRELTRRERELALIMDSVPAGIAAYDTDTVLRFANRRYGEFFGKPPAELVGHSFNEFLSPAALDILHPAWERCIRERVPATYRRTNRAPDGKESILDVILVPDDQGEKLAGTIALLLDVTGQVANEARIRELNESLERRVDERTADLRQALETLERSREELARSERMAALGALVAGVSHEMNTPIGNSMMAASTLADHATSLTRSINEGSTRRSELLGFLDQLREGTQLIQRNLYRADELLRSFKQVAADQTSEKRREFDLAEMAGEIVEAVSPSVKRSRHRIVLEIAAGIGMDSYPGPLGQVMINLINNAYLHAFDGIEEGGIVRIAARPEGDGEAVLLGVSDNGIGITADALGHVFEPFYTTKLGAGGSGLGLSITWNIVTGLLGGTIAVQSVPGEGTRFDLRLPRVAPTPAAAGTP